MNIPDEFGLFPFQRFTADELRHFSVQCVAHKVSDVNLIDGLPVSVSRFGRRVRCSSATLPTTFISSLVDELFGQEVTPRVLTGNPVDRTIQINRDVSGRYGLKRRERIRLCPHLIQDASGAEEKAVSITIHTIPTEIPDILSMDTEPGLFEAVVCKSGLGLIHDETGSRKSTLCSVLCRHIMDDFLDAKIMTYEDPVEYILGNENDLLPSHQTEIGRDVVSFAVGLRFTIRHNPEIIGVGEIGGNETTDATVQAGNTGYYCLSTMRTKSPGEMLARLLGLFPPVIRDSVAWVVLSLLQLILVQVLVRANDGGRKVAREYIVINDELRDNLSGMPRVEWEHHVDTIVRQEKRRIRDQILKVYIRGGVDRRGTILFTPPGELRS